MSRFMGCRTIAASAVGIGAFQMTKSIVNAKEAEKVKEATKVYGFIGIPDTHSLETYLKWKQIQYERVDVNPLKIEEFFAETDCGKLNPLLTRFKNPTRVNEFSRCENSFRYSSAGRRRRFHLWIESYHLNSGVARKLREKQRVLLA